MFQRFKEASSAVTNFVDQLADEQSRLRAQQAGAQSSNATVRRANRPLRPHATGPSKALKPNNEEADKSLNLTGPDPDPSIFESETGAEERIEIKQDGVSEQGRLSSETGDPLGEKQSTDGMTSVTETGQEGKKNEVDNSSEAVAELPDDVQAKLRKLAKLESKYQDLLKAYKRAHVRNALIEPFEARLRENTPLTSISDPTALVEYLNQIGMKGDMVMQELKKVSAEKDELKEKLEASRRDTEEAYNEVTRLKESQPEKDKPVDVPATNAATIETSSSSTIPEQQTEEVFSFDAEMPRLEVELQKRVEEVTQLKAENASLKRDLDVSKESAEQMMSDMEAARKDLESLQASHIQSENADRTERSQLETRVSELMTQLDESNIQLQNLHSSSRQANEDSAKHGQALQASIDALNTQLEASQTELAALRRKQVETAENHNAEVVKLEEALSDIKSRLQAAEENVSHQTNKLTASETALAQLKTQTEAQISSSEPHLPPVIASQNQISNDISASKKKNKKKNKKKGTANASAEVEPSDVSEAPVVNGKSTVETPNLDDEIANLQTRFADVMLQLTDKSAAFERVEKKLRDQDGLIEEIEGLRDELLSIGQEHVEAKDKLKQVEVEKHSLQQRVLELEGEVAQLREGQQAYENAEHTLVSLRQELEEYRGQAERKEVERAALEDTVNKLKQNLDERERSQASTIATSSEAQKKMEIDFDDLKAQYKSLQTNLSAAEQLAATRFKEMATLRDIIQKAQPELIALRSEVAELRDARDELSVKSKELRRLELREESLRSELNTIKGDISSKEQDIKSLNQKLSQETAQRLNVEETQRRAQRDLQKVQQERTEAVSTRDNLSRELEQANRQLEEARSRLDQLGHDVQKLNSDTDNLREEISLKTAQHASAEMLMTSVRDQAGEMAVQLKEARERCESLEEELTDVHRLMGERGRETETMRRLLADVETRAESRLKEMRERMELATQERDRAEEDASSIGRRKARELDDVKNRLRGIERDLKRTVEDREELQVTEAELRQQKTESDRRLEQSKQEIEDTRKAMGELRDALEDGERQSREFESERNELKRSLEELQQQLDKIQKSNKTLSDDLRSARATRMRPTDSPIQSTRSSQESSRPARLASPISPVSTRTTSFSLGSNANMDYVYLKNVLLQFLEQKDKNHQKQLIPVLGMLLHFDKKDEVKWMTAISSK